MTGNDRSCPTCGGSGVLQSIDPNTVIFFGVWPGTGGGHYAFDRSGTMRNVRLAFDQAASLPVRGNESVYERRQTQDQGYARVTHHRIGECDWTIVCCWDRSDRDKRGGCNAAFAVPIRATGEAVLDAAAVAFPAKWAQLDAAGGVHIAERE